MTTRLLPASLLVAILVTPAASGVTAGALISVKPAVVVYGHSLTISGRFAPGLSGQPVLVRSKEFGQAMFSSIALLSTTTGGRWRFKASPRMETAYKAQSAAETTAEAIARVRPLVTLRATRAGFLAKVVSARSYQRAFVLLQRRVRRHWQTLRRVALGNRPGTIHVHLPHGVSTIRVYLPKGQAGPNYLPAASRPVLVRR